MSIHAVVMSAIIVVFVTSTLALASATHSFVKADRSRIVSADRFLFATLVSLSIHSIIWCVLLGLYVSGLHALQTSMMPILKASNFFKIVGILVFLRFAYVNKHRREWVQQMGGDLFVLCGMTIAFWAVFFPPFVAL